MPELLYPHPPLADDVVRLRPWRLSDAPVKVEAFRDPLVDRFSWPHMTPYRHRDALRSFADGERARRRGEELSFALVAPADEDAVWGGGSLFDIHALDRRASIGYWLVPAARGRGVATHAVRLLAGWAFAGLRLARLELTCGPDNLASQRVAGRCGFHREGLLRSHTEHKGRRRDTVVFGLLRGELR